MAHSHSDTAVGLECPICFDPFRTPLMIDCGHSFCSDCLNTHIGTSTRFVCPICRKWINVPNGGISNFRRNFALEMATAKVPPLQGTRCSTHGNKDVDSFCRDCNIGVCSLCILKDHKHHNYIILEDSQDDIIHEYKQIKERIQKKIDLLDNNHEALCQSLVELEKKKHTTIEDIEYEAEIMKLKVTENFEENKEKLTKVKSELLETLDTLQTICLDEHDGGADRPLVETIKSISSLQKLEIEANEQQIMFPSINYLQFKNLKGLHGSNGIGCLDSVPYVVSFSQELDLRRDNDSPEATSTSMTDKNGSNQIITQGETVVDWINNRNDSSSAEQQINKPYRTIVDWLDKRRDSSSANQQINKRDQTVRRNKSSPANGGFGIAGRRWSSIDMNLQSVNAGTDIGLHCDTNNSANTRRINHKLLKPRPCDTDRDWRRGPKPDDEQASLMIERPIYSWRKNAET